MRDFSIIGDCDSAIDTTLGSVYDSEFENMWLSSVGNSAFICPLHFNTEWKNVSTFSQNGHGFDLAGGNTTLLTKCSCHSVGDGKAGFRIKSAATLIACNGMDVLPHASYYWGWFGNNEPVSRPIIDLIGCNLEDFRTAAIKIEGNGGHVSVRGSILSAIGTGVYQSLIYVDGAYHSILLDNGTIVGSKGAIRAGQSDILSTNGLHVIDRCSLRARTFNDYYRSDVGILYNVPGETISYIDYAKADLVISRGRFSSP